MTLSTVLSPPSPNSSCDGDYGDVCSPHHIQAQRLNNTAATYIENWGNGGLQNYEKTISILAKALRICDQQQEHEHAYDVCSCPYCSIDACIVSSEVDDHNNNDKDDSTNNINEDNNHGTNIYQRPIYVHEGHNMGSTLIQTIVFNLAMVHHLTAFAKNNNDNESITNKALQLYELAYDCNLSNTRSIRFDTNICNNLSHIYRYREQKEVEQQQLSLCSTVINTIGQKIEKQQQQQPITSDNDDDDDLEDDNDDSISNIISVDMADLIEFEYYSHNEEQEEYKHNTSLISLLTTISTTLSTASK